jgi:two-component system sensor histidine kinase CssS
MKNRPLVFQLWLFMAGIAAFFGLLLMLVMPKLLGFFFTDETFSTIESAQQESFPLILDHLRDELIARELGVEPQSPPKLPFVEDGNIRAVTHVVIQENGFFKSRFPLSEELQEMMLEGINLYVNDGVSRFSYPYEGKTLYFSVTYGEQSATGMYLISYMTNDYIDELTGELFERILWLLGVALLLAWIPAIFFARYLTRPLVTLQTHVREYALRELEEPVSVQRGDEIGQLASSIEQMRVQLKQHDETQQSVLQNISHELKTPVTVIRGYTQSIEDGMIDGEQLNHAVKIIDREAQRLQKRINELLYMTKLDYLAKHKVVYEAIHMHELVEAVAERMRWLKPDLNWEFDLQELQVKAEVEQWQVVLENVLDNQIRYAKSTIRFDLHRDDEGITVLRIWNDGPLLEEGAETQIFEAFRKGTNGKFGLGLVIVKRIAELHGIEVVARNEDGGVAFIFIFKGAQFL